MRRAETLKIPIFGVVLNHIKGVRFEIPTSDIDRTLGWPNIFEIPDDDAVPRAIHEGIPVVIHSPNSPAAKSFRELCGSVLEHVKERRKVTPRRERQRKRTPLMREYEEEMGKKAIWGGKGTKQYKKWRKARREKG